MKQDEVSAICAFMNEMLNVRDRLEPILSGQIKRGHCLAGSIVTVLSVAIGGAAFALLVVSRLLG